MRYRILIEQDEDGIFVAECPLRAIIRQAGLTVDEFKTLL